MISLVAFVSKLSLRRETKEKLKSLSERIKVQQSRKWQLSWIWGLCNPRSGGKFQILEYLCSLDVVFAD